MLDYVQLFCDCPQNINQAPPRKIFIAASLSQTSVISLQSLEGYIAGIYDIIFSFMNTVNPFQGYKNKSTRSLHFYISTSPMHTSQWCFKKYPFLLPSQLRKLEWSRQKLPGLPLGFLYESWSSISVEPMSQQGDARWNKSSTIQRFDRSSDVTA